MRRLAFVPLMVLLAGCLVLPRNYQRYTGGAEVQRKTVADKRDPNLLVASDGSVCSVSKSKYDKTATGDVVLCAWRDGRTDAQDRFPTH